MVEPIDTSEQSAFFMAEDLDGLETSAATTSTTTTTTREETKNVSKKQKDKDSKKLKNKTKQAITVLCKAEDTPYEELFCQGTATPAMFVAHFGNGDEAD